MTITITISEFQLSFSPVNTNIIHPNPNAETIDSIDLQLVNKKYLSLYPKISFTLPKNIFHSTQKKLFVA
jgi:hypothetical protein